MEGMRLSEFLRQAGRPQAFGRLVDGPAACAVAQIVEEAFGLDPAKVATMKEAELLRAVLAAYRIRIPRMRVACRKCGGPVQLPEQLWQYVVHLNDQHLAPLHVIADALAEIGL